MHTRLHMHLHIHIAMPLHIPSHTHIDTHIYANIYMCTCPRSTLMHTYTSTHTIGVSLVVSCETLQENCTKCCVHSWAMLANSLTKILDNFALQTFREKGRYAVVEDAAVLESRAGQRQLHQWLRQGQTEVASSVHQPL